MQVNPDYVDLIADINEFFEERVTLALQASLGTGLFSTPLVLKKLPSTISACWLTE